MNMSIFPRQKGTVSRPQLSPPTAPTGPSVPSPAVGQEMNSSPARLL